MCEKGLNRSKMTEKREASQIPFFKQKHPTNQNQIPKMMSWEFCCCNISQIVACFQSSSSPAACLAKKFVVVTTVANGFSHLSGTLIRKCPKKYVQQVFVIKIQYIKIIKPGCSWRDHEAACSRSQTWNDTDNWKQITDIFVS